VRPRPTGYSPLCGPPATLALKRESRAIPIIFASVADPVASGIVPGVNQPGGNITGFAPLEASLAPQSIGLNPVVRDRTVGGWTRTSEWRLEKTFEICGEFPSFPEHSRSHSAESGVTLVDAGVEHRHSHASALLASLPALTLLALRQCLSVPQSKIRHQFRTLRCR
jgi:hypothetical protein